MPGREDSFNSDLFDDPVFCGVGAEARWLYIWSKHNPSVDHAGFTRCALDKIAFSTGLTAAKVTKALAELDASGLAVYEREWLWCRHKVKKGWRNGGMATNIAKTVRRFEVDHPMRQRFVEEYADTPWLHDAPKGKEPLWPVVVAETRAVEPKSDTPPEGSPPGSGGDQYSNSSSKQPSTARSSRAPAPADELPADFPDELKPIVAKVKAGLDKIVEQKGGNVVRLAAVANVLTKFPRRDHLSHIDSVEHWALFGNGANQTHRKDWVAFYRNWISGKPDYIGGKGARAGIDRTKQRLEEQMK